MTSFKGLDIPAENRGFWFRIEESKVDPERGNPEIIWKVFIK